MGLRGRVLYPRVHTERRCQSRGITGVLKSGSKHLVALCTKAKRVKCLNAFNYARVREKGQGLGGLGPQGSYLEREENHSLMATHSLGPHLGWR